MKLGMLLATVHLAAVAVVTDAAPSAGAETKDRISAEELAGLVVKPSAQLEAGDIEGARASLAKLIDRSRRPNNRDTLRTADLYMAFGLAAYSLANESREPQMIEASIDAFEKAASSYEAVYGPLHPEVSLAMTTLADGLNSLVGEESIPRQIGLVRKVLAVRRARLGATHIETLASMGDLGKLIVDDPNSSTAQLDEAVLLMADAINLATLKLPENGDASPAFFGLVAARAETRLGHSDRASANIDLALAAIDPDGDHCGKTSRQAEALVQELVEAQRMEYAARIEQRYHEICGLSEDIEELSKELMG